jgi:hypothetical protein
VRVQTALIPKAGSAPDENEDRFVTLESARGWRAAVADGATESPFSGQWAEALLAAWIAQPSATFGELTVSRARDAWAETIPPPESLPWHGQMKLAEGSHAAVALIDIRHGLLRSRWTARAVGDCTVFVLKGRRIRRMIHSFPMHSSSEFGYTPALVSTLNRSAPRTLVATGRVRPPAEIWLATDAFAQACLRAEEEGRPAWDWWAGHLEAGESFAGAVDEWRAAHWMRNDDVCVVRFVVE